MSTMFGSLEPIPIFWKILLNSVNIRVGYLGPPRTNHSARGRVGAPIMFFGGIFIFLVT